MSQNIAIKDLRQNLSKIADLVERGESVNIFRRSKLSFKLVPANIAVEDEWETVVDFTHGGKKKGEKVEDVLGLLQKMNKDSA